MASPFKYYRDKFEDETTYTVFGPSKEGDPDTAHIGHMSIDHYPIQFHPNFDDTERYDEHGLLAAKLGVSRDLVRRVHSQEVNADNAHPDGEVPGSISSSIDYAKDSLYYDEHHNNRSFDKHLERLQKDPRFNPETLFDETPAHLQVFTAFFDPKVTPAMGTITGLIKNDNPYTPIMPSSSLSPYSSRLSRNALKKGWVIPNPENPTAKVSNNSEGHPDVLGSVDSDTGEALYRGERIPQAEVHAAQATYKNMVRGRPTHPPRLTTPITDNGLGHQFKEYPLTGIGHDVLPGMEESFNKVMKRSDWSENKP